MNNLFASIPKQLPEELTELLLETKSVRVERIISHGHASPEDFWYDQDNPEWVVVLKGAARLRLENQEAPMELAPGDFVNIPAHARHRVEWTTPDETTVWLAIHHG